MPSTLVTLRKKKNSVSDMSTGGWPTLHVENETGKYFLKCLIPFNQLHIFFWKKTKHFILLYQMRWLTLKLTLFPVLVFSALSGSNDRDNQPQLSNRDEKRDSEILKIQTSQIVTGKSYLQSVFEFFREACHQTSQHFLCLFAFLTVLS